MLGRGRHQLASVVPVYSRLEVKANLSDDVILGAKIVATRYSQGLLDLPALPSKRRRSGVEISEARVRLRAAARRRPPQRSRWSVSVQVLVR